MPVLHFSVKRRRQRQSGKATWVEVGFVTVNTDDSTGTFYLHDRDEDWKLFPVQPRQVADKD
jgi:hypothetical protein